MVSSSPDSSTRISSGAPGACFIAFVSASRAMSCAAASTSGFKHEVGRCDDHVRAQLAGAVEQRPQSPVLAAVRVEDGHQPVGLGERLDASGANAAK